MVMPLLTGFLIGFVLDQQGRRVVCVCPPGETPPPGFMPISPPMPPFTGPGMPPFPGPGMPVFPSPERLVEVGDVSLTKNFIQPYGASTTYPVERLLDARGAAMILLVVDSSCNQALTIQVIGHVQNAPGDTNGRVPLGGGIAIAAGNTTVQRQTITVVRRNYSHPWLGVTIASGATPPTTGSVQVAGYFERSPFIRAEGV